MHIRLTGFEQVRVASTMADDVLGQGCRIFTPECLKCRGTQVVMQSGFRAPFSRMERRSTAAEFRTSMLQSKQGRLTRCEAGLGFCLEGVRSQPSIDEVLNAAEGDVVVLKAPTGRRVALVEVTPGG